MLGQLGGGGHFKREWEAGMVQFGLSNVHWTHWALLHLSFPFVCMQHGMKTVLWVVKRLSILDGREDTTYDQHGCEELSPAYWLVGRAF